VTEKGAGTATLPQGRAVKSEGGDFESNSESSLGFRLQPLRQACRLASQIPDSTVLLAVPNGLLEIPKKPSLAMS
jgi:hypothetical protein